MIYSRSFHLVYITGSGRGDEVYPLSEPEAQQMAVLPLLKFLKKMKIFEEITSLSLDFFKILRKI